MKSAQQGNGAVRLLVTVALVVVVLLIWWGKSPAEPQDLQIVISLAASNPEAKETLSASLKETPNPSRADLHRLRSRVNEILVNELSKEATGDKTLATPSAQKAIGEQQEAARMAALESKAWGEMNIGEQAEFLLNKTHALWVSLVLIVLAVVRMAVVRLRSNQ